MKSHRITAKSGKLLDAILHGKWRKCKYYKMCEDARKDSMENIGKSVEF